MLPLTTTPPTSVTGGSTSAPRQSTTRQQYKASESGTGSLLPDHSSNSRKAPQMSRIRTLSDMSSSTSAPQDDSPTEGLRRRTTLTLDEDQMHKLQRRHSMSSSLPLPLHNSSSSSSSRTQRTYVQVSTKGGFTFGHFAQALVVCIVFYLVFDAHYKVQEAAHRLEHYKEEEAVLMDQMERIEGRAMELQEQLKTLKEEPTNVQEEIFQWKRELFEVNKEVHALQDFMQDGARKNLDEQYGQGAIHINLNLAMGDVKASAISVELFDEAPHASWVFLQQIAAGDWDESSFIWHPSHMVLASPSKAATHKLEFIEKSYHHHESWTIGLTPSHNGGYNLYVNLKDNAHVHDGDVCLGKVVDGFDTLQKLMHLDTVAKVPGGEKAYLDPPIGIHEMSISANKRSRTRRY